MRLLATIGALALSMPMLTAAAEPANILHPPIPQAFYPEGAVRRKEQGSPVVMVCVGANGKLLREPVVVETSGFPEIDGAAIKLAKATRYAAGTDERGAALRESCIKFSVTFAIKKG